MTPGPDVVTPTAWYAARRSSFGAASALPPESVPLDRAVGRLLAGSVVALADIPHYASSAMDGWAVAGDAPWRIVESAELHAGDAARVVTGGIIPSGARGVLRSEHGHEDGRMLERNDRAGSDEPRPGQHIRPAAEEARESEVVVSAGTVLNPVHVALAASCGHDAVTVARSPRVRLLLTGNEVVESGLPTAGQVRDSFGVQLPSVVGMLGGRVIRSFRLPDDLESIIAALSDDSAETDDESTDVIITTGGTGHSAVDHLHAALEAVGAELLVDGIAMRPGGPSLLARLTDGRVLVGLPGNPLAAMMGMMTLAGPLLAALQGAPEPGLGSARLATALAGSPGRTRLVPFTLVDGLAVPSRWHGAGMLRGLADAAGVAVVPAEGASEGDRVETLPLPWLEGRPLE